MAHLSDEQLHRLARLGAAARLEQLRQEEAAIRAQYPDLFAKGKGGRAAKGSFGVARKRKPMSAAARRAVSERMSKYWADRRKKAGKS